MKRFATLAFASLSAFALLACQKEESTGQTPAATAEATADPAHAITAIAQKLKAGDILSVLQMSLPPKHYERMKADWKNEMAAKPVSDDDRAEFAALMTKLTASDAENALMAEAEPQLANFETEMAAQMPMMVGMGQGFAMQSIQSNEALSEAQKKQAGDVVGAVATWLQGVNFADRGLARQAIGSVVATARALELKTLDEVHALEFEAAMGKAGIAFNGLKEVLAVYGFKLDETLDSVKTQVLSQNGGNAVVKVDYQILGQPMSLETPMVLIDGRWYGKDTVEQIEKGLNSPAESTPAAELAEPEAAEAESAPTQG